MKTGSLSHLSSSPPINLKGVVCQVNLEEVIQIRRSDPGAQEKGKKIEKDKKWYRQSTGVEHNAFDQRTLNETKTY